MERFLGCYIAADWPAPTRVRAYSTTRRDGFSKTPYAKFNLSTATGDDPAAVIQNRAKLQRDLGIPAPCWLKQAHTNQVINLDLPTATAELQNNADAAFTTLANKVCAVLTADCVPILICNRSGTVAAAIHAGWRGIVNGVIEATISKIAASGFDPAQLMAWLGPAIGPEAFCVTHEVLTLFTERFPEAEHSFIAKNAEFTNVNLYHLASCALKRTGVTQIFGGKFCTFTQAEDFFSFRRDGMNSGRIATLIWLAE